MAGPSGHTNSPHPSSRIISPHGGTRQPTGQGDDRLLHAAAPDIAPALSQDHRVEQSAANDCWVSRADYVNTEARAMTARRTFYTQSSCPLCPQKADILSWN